jgi:phosphate transport system ATP-binding protein
MNDVREAPSLEADRLNLWYGAFQALVDVSLAIRPRRIAALIGPSGCGKSTLLRSFNRLNERLAGVRIAGEVRVLGRNIHDPDVNLGELRKAVAMVFQRPNPLPMSVYENVAFGLRIHATGRRLNPRLVDDAVESALRDVLLWHDVADGLRRDARSLTLEQQQKLCIARVLPLRPHVILMDEPCSALDAEATEAIERLLATLKETFTIVIVTHNMAQARRISDDSLFMLLGRVLEQAPTVDLFLRPARPETEAYVEGRYG